MAVPWQAVEAPDPRLLVLNQPLAIELGLDIAWLEGPDGLRLLVGNIVPSGSTAVAQAYAGHQFGGYAPRLGDGRALLLGEVGGLIHDVDLPPGVRVRAVTGDVDLARIDELMKTIWGPDHGDGSLTREMRANPDALDVVVVEESVDGPVLCAGWLRYSTGTDFASMWGGSTLPEWRRKGLYRATVTHRARLARERGYRFMRLDTSPDSRPILVRLGLSAVAATTPYILDARK